MLHCVANTQRSVNASKHSALECSDLDELLLHMYELKLSKLH